MWVQPNTSVVRAIARGQWQAPLGSSRGRPPDHGQPAAVLASVKDKPSAARVEQKNGVNNARQKWRDAPLTKKAPYKPCPQKRMTASWSRPHVGSTEYKRGSRDCSRPMAGSPRIIARPTTRSRAACRRARVRQGQAFGGAEEAPSLTATARDGDGNVRSGWKNARGAGRTKEWSNNARQKWRDAPLTKKAPYKPYARIGPVRICAGGAQ